MPLKLPTNIKLFSSAPHSFYNGHSILSNIQILPMPLQWPRLHAGLCDCLFLFCLFFVLFSTTFSGSEQVTKSVSKTEKWSIDLMSRTQKTSIYSLFDGVFITMFSVLYTVIQYNTTLLPNVNTIALGMFCRAKYTHHTFTAIIKQH